MAKENTESRIYVLTQQIKMNLNGAHTCF